MLHVQRVQLAYNNVYIVDDEDARVLVDTGPDFPGAFETIIEALAGRMPGAVVATHGHIDHASLGAAWRAHGIPVYVGEQDLPLCTAAPITRDEEFEGMVGWLKQSGAPDELCAETLAALIARRQKLHMVYQPDAGYEPPVARGNWPTPLRFRPFKGIPIGERRLPEMPGLLVIPAPGHTPGNLVLLHDDGTLFSGDQLLPDITPTPAIQGRTRSAPGQDWRLRSLPLFIASLERLLNLSVTRCYPGHGDPFETVRATIQQNLDQVADRSAKVLAALDEEGPGTLYELGMRLYPRALQRRFWQICSTLQGNLDLLEASGKVHRGDANRWERTP